MRYLSLEKRTFYFVLITLVIVTIKVPFIQEIPLYSLLYLYYFVVYIDKKSINGLLRWHVIWLLIMLLWGLFLSMYYGISSENVYNLIWLLSLIIVPVCISSFFKNENQRLYIYQILIFLTIAIAVSGVYESLTGHFYPLTKEKYAVRLNSFGLYRPNTIFYNTNDNAIFFFICIVFAYMYPHQRYESKYIRMASLFLFAFNIWMVDSRGAELAFVMFLLIYYYLTLNKKLRWLLAFITIPILFIWLPYVIQDEFFDMSDRLPIWLNSYNHLKDTDFIGVGPGMISAYNELHYSGLTEVSDVHNFFLELFCDYGIVAIVTIPIWYFSYLRYCLKNKNFECFPQILSTLVALLLASITCSSLVGKSMIILLFGIILSEIKRSERKV